MHDEALEDAPLRHLVMRVARVSRRAWLADLEPYNLTPHLARALGAVAGAGAEGLRSADLAQALRISPRSATEVTDGLVERGLVDRTPSLTDRRAKVITLTDDGASLAGTLERSRQARDDAMFDALSAADRKRLQDLLVQVLRANEDVCPPAK